MAKHLVIVESPAKAKTLGKYLGKDFSVLASYGHVRDLLPKEGAVDPDHDFAMTYQVIDKNQKHIDAISKAMKGADALYLATDPDREGEAISWHLYEILAGKKLLKEKPIHRIVFHEITRQAVQDAVAHPRDISMNLVNAQQARRALDYLVGFNLSPLLWKKIRRGLSAGRVQSPALRMIVEREQEIENFKSREYWTVEADTAKGDERFKARLTHHLGKKLTQFSIADEQKARQVEKSLAERAAGRLTVVEIEKKQRRRNPAAPFITSTLQQEAARKLGFTAQRTMRTAQQLYEGVDIGQGAVGLITYMRTDSVNLAQEAVADIRGLIAERFGPDRLPEQPQVYKTKSKNAQEAHEAIRPTSVTIDPESVKEHLTADQLKLYRLVWQRTVACQMKHATIDTVGVDLEGGKGDVFRATGSTIVDAGFMAVYREDSDDRAAETDEQQNLLPELARGDVVALERIRTEQHFTEPPPRYTEASLIKALEEHGIGRPSTYASIIATLQQREYVIMDKKRFVPTDVGRIVNRFLTDHFGRYVDYEFTAKLEDDLDAVSRGEQEWVPLMHSFWEPFKHLVDDKEKSVQRKDVTQEALDELCPKCGKPLSIRLGRRGRFIGCTGFPDCDYTRNLGDDKGAPPMEQVEGRSCPNCGGGLVMRNGPYGRFIGCSNYPKCKFIESLNKPADTSVPCPKCGKGTMLQRRSRRGKVFYSCSTYPACDYAVWNEPVATPCPECHWPMLTLKTTKRGGTELVCPQKECGHTEPYQPEGAGEEEKRQAHG
jgi:DNA topoisomerase-1